MAKYCFYVILILTMSSCDSLFDTHPYDVDFEDEKNINDRQIKSIEQTFADRDTLHIAFISDTHLWHSDARDEVADVNRRNVDFVVHCGDLTDTGTTKEFEWSRDIMNGLHVPYIALVGNHDFLGTGDQTYSVMYGKMDFSFIPNRSLGPISSGDVKVFSCSPESKECLPLIYGSHKT